MEDLNEHPHYALLKSESFVSDNERAWLSWVKKVERKLGHDLDGNQFIHGYSLDFAGAAFDAGVSVDDYVIEVKADKAELDAMFGPVVA